MRYLTLPSNDGYSHVKAAKYFRVVTQGSQHASLVSILRLAISQPGFNLASSAVLGY